MQQFKYQLSLWISFTFMMLLFGSCSGYKMMNGPVFNPGVSLELAELRKQEVSGLKYKLYFKIPEDKNEEVSGKVVMDFMLNRTNVDKTNEFGGVLLDCRINKKKIYKVWANGRQVKKWIVNEHIVIPESVVKKGANQIAVQFVAEDQSLNRNAEYLYTLLVPDRARTLFPCFDQPNLKAEFSLQLDIPARWTAVSNTAIINEKTTNDRKEIHFAPTEPLSTYLFSFVAGLLNRTEQFQNGQKIAVYHRETDPQKLMQLDTIFHQVFASIKWMEEYTGVPYPFAKYDLIILPGFQYGGMEHTGATLYNDRRMFLDEHPTPDEELGRTLLIAHETAHMWFGDLVTMNWFNDVWTKEVFANYFAARITEPLFPDVNHRLSNLRTFYISSLGEDRTPGTTSIRQPLDNLRNSGLIYGQIIYNKAPIVMEKLVELIGQEAFQSGIREYLNTYAYGNATWDDLVSILDSKTDADLKQFSDVWVNQKGMPEIDMELKGNRLIVRQRDLLNRGIFWPQRFNVTLCGKKTISREINLTDSILELPLDFYPDYVLPNTDGRGYGRFLLSSEAVQYIVDNWFSEKDEVCRLSLLMTLYENYQSKRLSPSLIANTLLKGLPIESNPIIASALVGYLNSCVNDLNGEPRLYIEQRMYELYQTHKLPSVRLQLLRALMSMVVSPDVIEALYGIWSDGKSELLSERDYITLSYELAIRMPERSAAILAKQRERITNPDRIREYDYVARALNHDTTRLDNLFESLLIPSNRRIEPWTQTVLYYLNHPTRQDYSVKYIRPALDALRDVQRTGDIFFPRGWVGALLGGYRRMDAYQKVQDFLKDNPQYPPLLKNKILQAAYPLFRCNED